MNKKDEIIRKRRIKIKSLVIEFINSLKQDRLYEINKVYTSFVNDLAEGVPNDIDLPWYNNGKILIEPSVSYQDMKNKDNLISHYDIFEEDIKKEIKYLKNKILKYKEWLIEEKFDYSSKYLRLEPSPLSNIGHEAILVYAFEIQENKNGIRIKGKSYPKDIDFFNDFNKEAYHISVMTENDFNNFLTFEINFLKKHYSLSEIEKEINIMKKDFFNE